VSREKNSETGTRQRRPFPLLHAVAEPPFKFIGFNSIELIGQLVLMTNYSAHNINSSSLTEPNGCTGFDVEFI
jgi:hypothetical protein